MSETQDRVNAEWKKEIADVVGQCITPGCRSDWSCPKCSKELAGRFRKFLPRLVGGITREKVFETEVELFVRSGETHR